jgi:lipopolysaccharide/colanic/teichoic acid biosynthesis glycosyltransferase
MSDKHLVGSFMDQADIPRSVPLSGHRAMRASVPKAVLRTRMCVVLAFIDTFAIVCSFALVSILHLHRGNYDSGTAEQIAIMIPTFLIVALFCRSYSPTLIQDSWASIGRALRAMAITCATVVLVAFFLRLGEDWSRLGFIVHCAFAAVLVAILRYSFGNHASFLIGGEPYEVLYIDETADVAAHELLTDGAPLPKPLRDQFDPTSLSPASYDRFAQSIGMADRVVVRCAADRRHFWAQALKGADVQGELLAPELAVLHPLDCSFHGGMPTMVVSRGPLGLRHRLVKRTFDIFVAGSALVVLSPLLAVTALIIRMQDGGPVFFRQIRVGRSNRQFRILKFRSMYVAGSDEAGNRSASRSDDRITPFGRFIRATSIDELPQLLNVIGGDMSIVGPRPHALGSTADNLLFWDIDERYWQRHVMKPGLTGLAQVRGYRGATNCKEDLLNRLQSDLEYLRSWTIWRDFAIVLRTLGVLFHKNAY